MFYFLQQLTRPHDLLFRRLEIVLAVQLGMLTLDQKLSELLPPLHSLIIFVIRHLVLLLLYPKHLCVESFLGLLSLAPCCSGCRLCASDRHNRLLQVSLEFHHAVTPRPLQTARAVTPCPLLTGLARTLCPLLAGLGGRGASTTRGGRLIPLPLRAPRVQARAVGIARARAPSQTLRSVCVVRRRRATWRWRRWLELIRQRKHHSGSGLPARTSTPSPSHHHSDDDGDSADAGAAAGDPKQQEEGHAAIGLLVQPGCRRWCRRWWNARRRWWQHRWRSTRLPTTNNLIDHLLQLEPLGFAEADRNTRSAGNAGGGLLH